MMTLLPKTPNGAASLEEWISYRTELAGIVDDDPVRASLIDLADRFISYIQREDASAPAA